MSSVTKIELDYAKAMTQVRQLEGLSDELERTGERLRDSMNRLSSGWQGSGANAYRAKGEKLADQITNNAGQLQATAEAIRTISRKIIEAEMENKQIAEIRKY